MSIVRLIVKQEMVFNLIYLFPECKEKCNFSNNSSNVLYYGTLHRVNFKPRDVICQKWYFYQACSVTKLHITEGADYTDLSIA